MSRAYFLKARLGEDEEIVSLTCADDEDASWQGVQRVMDLAMESRVWAKGAIFLVGPSGEIVQSMPAKGEDGT